MLAELANPSPWVEFEICGQKAFDFHGDGFRVHNIEAPNLGRILFRKDRIDAILEYVDDDRVKHTGLECAVLIHGPDEFKVIGSYEEVLRKVIGADGAKRQ